MVAKKSGAEILNNKIRLGYSKSLEKGIFKAKSLGFSHIISLDADGELSPLHIKKFLKLFKKHKIIFGIRKKKARFAEYLISHYFKKRFGVKDITCGMKGLDLSLVVNKKIKIIDGNLGLSIFNYLLRKNKSFTQCMVSGKKRIDQPRYGTAFISNLKIIFTMLKFIFENHFKNMCFKRFVFNFSLLFS